MSDINFYQGLKDILATKSNTDEHIPAIKERLEQFFNLKNIHFLFGSGTSSDAIPNMKGLYDSVLELIKQQPKPIQEEFKLIASRAKKENLEDILGILYSHRVYLKGSEKADEIINCDEIIKLIEKEVFEKINVDLSSENAEKLLKTYMSFYRKIAYRNKDMSRLNIFTTNNDLFTETALDNLNIHYVNGFSGGLNKYFNPSLFNYTFSKRMDTSIEKYEPVENMVFLYKLHGSVNWIEDNSKSNTFFNIKEISKPEFDENNILIYPTPTKQNKSLGSPYVELFREFQKKLLEPHGVLFIIGYSFSDEHVNNIIYQALATNSTINVVVFNKLEDKEIAKVDDSRIFRIWGENNKIHYFDYIVNTLLADINANGSQDDALEQFIEFYHKNLAK